MYMYHVQLGFVGFTTMEANTHLLWQIWNLEALDRGSPCGVSNIRMAMSLVP